MFQSTFPSISFKFSSAGVNIEPYVIHMTNMGTIILMRKSFLQFEIVTVILISYTLPEILAIRDEIYYGSLCIKYKFNRKRKAYCTFASICISCMLYRWVGAYRTYYFNIFL